MPSTSAIPKARTATPPPEIPGLFPTRPAEQTPADPYTTAPADLPPALAEANALLARSRASGDLHGEFSALLTLHKLHDTLCDFPARDTALRDLLAVARSLFTAPPAPANAVLLSGFADNLCDLHHKDDAERLYRRALEIDEAAYGPSHPQVAVRLSKLARFLNATAFRLSETESLMRRALAINEAHHGPLHRHVAHDIHNLARLMQETGRLGEAESLMHRALHIFTESGGEKHPNVEIIVHNLASLYHLANRPDKEERMRLRHLEILLRLTAQTGLEPPNLQATVRHYSALCQHMQVELKEFVVLLTRIFSRNGISEEKTKIILAFVFKTE